MKIILSLITLLLLCGCMHRYKYPYRNDFSRWEVHQIEDLGIEFEIPKTYEQKFIQTSDRAIEYNKVKSALFMLHPYFNGIEIRYSYRIYFILIEPDLVKEYKSGDFIIMGAQLNNTQSGYINFDEDTLIRTWRSRGQVLASLYRRDYYTPDGGLLIVIGFVSQKHPTTNTPEYRELDKQTFDRIVDSVRFLD